MKTIIEQITEKIKSQMENFFEIEGKSIAEIEKFFSEMFSENFSAVVSAYYEKWDKELLADKKARKKSQLVIERKNVPRDILTNFGMLRYHRTYYYQKSENAYVFPTDIMANIQSYHRISQSTEYNLVAAAMTDSYRKASKYVTDNRVSKQTVMNKIRNTYVPEEMVHVKRSVPYLHIDADEDHIHLQNGGKPGIVPLISVYEGIKHVGKKNECINKFSISAYGENISDIWDKVLAEIEDRYELENTKIYLHGDGATWIRAGLSWLPNAVFVLDQFHKNKAIKKSVANMKAQDGIQHQQRLRQALKNGDVRELINIRNKMVADYPECKKDIEKNIKYLYNNIDGISIRQRDTEANNGGATEPHVSHILSARLSSRPMGWSKETLEKFAPILASKRFAFGEPIKNSEIEYRREQKEKAKRYIKNSLGLPDPDIAVSLADSVSGRVCGLYNALRPFIY